MSLVIKQARFIAQGSGRVMPGVGDPGIFGSIGRFLGGTIKTAAQLVPGPVGSLARRIFQPQAAPVIVNGRIDTGANLFQQQQQQVGPPRPTAADRLRVAGQALVPGGVEPFDMNGVTIACPTGHHPNKSDYFLQNGTFIQKGTRCVKNRRRNPLNARAADRAISRIESAKRATKRLGRVTIRKKC